MSRSESHVCSKYGRSLVKQTNKEMLFRPLRRLGVVFKHVRMASPYTTSSSVDDEVLIQQIDTKGIITLNRPKALNALNLNMIQKIMPQMTTWENDPHMTMVIMKGTGDKAFCAGGDIVAVTESGKLGGQLAKDFFKEEYILNNKIGTYEIPYIAFIDGITMGGGVGLSVHGTYRVATERTLFAMPETAIGLFPDVGGGYFLSRLGGRLGIYLALTGFRLKGRDVQKAGVATHFVQSDKMHALEESLLKLHDPEPLDVAHVLDKFQHESTGIPDTDFILRDHMEEINRLFEGETVEEIMQNLEKDGSPWASKQLEILKKMSPVSMKITLRLLNEGSARTLQEDLEVEYRLSQRCIEDKDFYEGVRAVLIDKDQSPKWDPTTVEGVTKEHVDWYFSPLPPERELQL
ncbi:3-hydroxyisobutyryl-CoA hydrolase, mitochondrial-like isoform X1 [Ruditapes philippinarum]|uniref:3-hydroxyisobutyryl-CoA hydrolase, mitochondrial-like isoform X1 n=2 Tax=Ruditapes philippinarum TaxID=129788 RepID=UPI00295C24DC|nr:3-hydroxyisobutyryl-CoA hydrolase, mitochondrial-like isoform X1 [Ruditapes philippinarum]